MSEIIDPRSVDRPELLHRQVGAATQCHASWWRAAASTSTTWCCRAWCTWRSCAARTRTRRSSPSTRSAALKMPGVLRVFTGRDLARHCEPWVATLGAPQGHEVGAAATPAARAATWVGEAVAAVVAESRAVAEDAVAQSRASTTSRCPRWSTWRRRSMPGDARDPPRARRQPLLPARQRDRQGRRRLRGRAQGRRGHLPQRPPHRRDRSSRARSWPTTTALRPSSPCITRRRRRT